MFTAAFPGNRLPIPPYFAWRETHRKHNFPSIVTSIRVYRAVAWQRADQVRYYTLLYIFLIMYIIIYLACGRKILLGI
jgi:hypothetical protein